METINLEMLIYKAKQFNFNPQTIEYILKSSLSFKKEDLQKFGKLLKSVKEIEKNAQES